MFTVVVITREAKRAHEAYWSGGYDTTPVANSGIIRIKVPISYANSTAPDPNLRLPMTVAGTAYWRVQPAGRRRRIERNNHDERHATGADRQPDQHARH